MHEAADFDCPGARDEVLGARGYGFLIGRELIEVVIVRDVLVRSLRVADGRHVRARSGLHVFNLFAHRAFLIGRRKVAIEPARAERRRRQRPTAQKKAA